MSALSMPTCGRPGAVSSILTAIVGVFGTPPMPVNGFTASAAGGRPLVVLGEAAADDAAGVVAPPAVDFFLSLPVHAVASRPTATVVTRTNRDVREMRVMAFPLPVPDGGRGCHPPIGPRAAAG